MSVLDETSSEILHCPHCNAAYDSWTITFFFSCYGDEFLSEKQVLCTHCKKPITVTRKIVYKIEKNTTTA